MVAKVGNIRLIFSILKHFHCIRMALWLNKGTYNQVTDKTVINQKSNDNKTHVFSILFRRIYQHFSDPTYLFVGKICAPVDLDVIRP